LFQFLYRVSKSLRIKADGVAWLPILYIHPKYLLGSRPVFDLETGFLGLIGREQQQQSSVQWPVFQGFRNGYGDLWLGSGKNGAEECEYAQKRQQVLFHGCKLSKWDAHLRLQHHGASCRGEKRLKNRKKQGCFCNLPVFSPTFALPKQGHKIPC
jgi:hypothetical protein